jgi:hypothetical protein
MSLTCYETEVDRYQEAHENSSDQTRHYIDTEKASWEF